MEENSKIKYREFNLPFFFLIYDMKKILIVLMLCFAITSCDQKIARNFGGTTTIKLDPGQKLIEATWKESSLWYLTEPMESGYEPKTKVFKESSEWRALEGKVIFIETR